MPQHNKAIKLPQCPDSQVEQGGKLAGFVAGAMFSVLSGWLDDDLQTPLQEMSQIFYKLIRPSVLYALGLSKS